MPNYVTNNCDFNLSLTELLWVWVLIDVTDYKDKNYKNWYYNLRFNLHLLFPDYFVDEYFEYSYLSDSQTKDKSQKDFIINNTFDNKWNYDWYVNHIWCKWDVNIEVFCGNPDEPNFSCWFESPRSTKNHDAVFNESVNELFECDLYILKKSMFLCVLIVKRK